MRRIKKSIYIGGVKYTVKTQNKIAGYLGPGIYIMGQFRPKTHEIVYVNKLKESKKVTIIHELLHAICHEMCIDLKEEEVNVASRELTGSLDQLGMLK